MHKILFSSASALLFFDGFPELFGHKNIFEGIGVEDLSNRIRIKLISFLNDGVVSQGQATRQPMNSEINAMDVE